MLLFVLWWRDRSRHRSVHLRRVPISVQYPSPCSSASKLRSDEASRSPDPHPRPLTRIARAAQRRKCWAVTLVTIAATYLMTPFVIHSLSQEGYGIWTLITSSPVTSACSPSACHGMRAIPGPARGGARRTEGERSDRQLCGLYLMMGGVAVLVGAGLTGMFLAVYGPPPELQRDALVACGVMVLVVSSAFIGLLPEGIMFAHHDFVLRNVVRIGGVLLRLSLTIGLLTAHASLTALAVVQLFCFVFDFSLSWLLIRRRYPAVRISLRDFDWRMVRQILSFSLYVLLLEAPGLVYASRPTRS